MRSAESPRESAPWASVFRLRALGDQAFPIVIPVLRGARDLFAIMRSTDTRFAVNDDEATMALDEACFYWIYEEGLYRWPRP